MYQWKKSRLYFYFYEMIYLKNESDNIIIIIIIF